MLSKTIVPAWSNQAERSEPSAQEHKRRGPADAQSHSPFWSMNSFEGCSAVVPRCLDIPKNTLGSDSQLCRRQELIAVINGDD